MSRTFDENKTAINQLWPVAQFTDEEKRLWHDDLQPLDQDMLYDAIRNVKRTHDSVYPQLKWILDAYRELNTLRRAALRQTKQHEPKEKLTISEERDRETAAWITDWIDKAEPRDYRVIYDAIFADDTFPNLHSITALRLVMNAKARLLGETPQFGRVGRSGNVSPIFTADGVDGPTPASLRS